MFPDTSLLRIPGPTPIPSSVQHAMNQHMIGHRGTETTVLMKEIKQKLKPVFGTKQDVMLLTSSGTSALEAAVVNTASAGDEIMVIVTGAFGDRFAKICESYKLKLHRIDVTWGKSIDVEEIKEVLERNPNIKVVFSTFCETSTAVLNPIEKLSEIVHETSDALVVVDGVSVVGGIDSKMDEWEVDILITGSQKAMMLPPGLAFIVVSDRAWKVIETNKQPRFYLDLKKYHDNLLDNSTPFTPAISLLYGLRQVLNLFEEEGLQEVYARHDLMMRMTRAGMRALDIPLLTKDEDASPTVTAIKPDSFDATALRQLVKKDFNLELAGGQQHLKETIIRIGHMGYCNPADVLQTISLIEIGMEKLGAEVTLGKGIAAAQEVYLTGGK